MSAPALAVLDFDGTLVRLGVDWAGVRASLADELATRRLHPADGVLATIRALDAAGEQEAGRACRAIVNAAEREAAERAPVNAALLGWLHDSVQQATLAVLTLNDRSAVLAAAPRLGLGSRLMVADVIGRDDAPPKPDPAGLRCILARHGIAASEALLIGDSEVDHACGRAAGVATLDVRAIGCEWRAAATSPTFGEHLSSPACA